MQMFKDCIQNQNIRSGVILVFFSVWFSVFEGQFLFSFASFGNLESGSASL